MNDLRRVQCRLRSRNSWLMEDKISDNCFARLLDTRNWSFLMWPARRISLTSLPRLWGFQVLAQASSLGGDSPLVTNLQLLCSALTSQCSPFMALSKNESKPRVRERSIANLPSMGSPSEAVFWLVRSLSTLTTDFHCFSLAYIRGPAVACM